MFRCFIQINKKLQSNRGTVDKLVKKYLRDLCSSLTEIVLVNFVRYVVNIKGDKNFAKMSR